MQKLKMESLNITQSNIEKIVTLFPNAISEAKDDKGKLIKVINFDKLRQELADEIIDNSEESYDFTWVGKNDAIVKANTPIRKTLRPCIEESKNFETTENLYIEGDNLDVLKLLQESYLGNVKMIYIDPPYNTGKDFIYKDNFHKSQDEYDEESGMYDDEGNALFVQNNDTNPRFHSDWCSMIYPRLKLARNLLTDDGVIFISIDGNEVHNLKKICNEIFGEANFIGEIVWQTATDNNPTQISMEHEYIICYSKNKFSQPKWNTKSEKAKKIYDKYLELKSNHNDNVAIIHKELKTWIKNNKNDLKSVSHYSFVDEKGVYYPGNSSNTKDGGYKFDIVHPITQKICKKPDFGYRWTEETFLEADKNKDVEWGIDETTIPKIKKRIETVLDTLKSYYYEDNRYWTKYLTNLMGKKVFDNPKSVNLLKRLLIFTTSKYDIILDFFSGSATTAHAVMQLNAEDDGNRKFIMVQIPEECNKKSEAFKAGYKNICEIGKERIRRAGEKIKSELANNQNSLVEEAKKIPDFGFRVLKIDETNMKDVYYGAGELKQTQLDNLISNIKDDRNDLDLLYGVLLDWGLQLSSKHEIMQIDGFRVHNYDNLSLIACFETNISEKLIREIAKMQPLRVVFRDSSFTNSPTKINIEEIFKINAPNTSIRVI